MPPRPSSTPLPATPDPRAPGASDRSVRYAARESRIRGQLFESEINVASIVNEILNDLIEDVPSATMADPARAAATDLKKLQDSVVKAFGTASKFTATSKFIREDYEMWKITLLAAIGSTIEFTAIIDAAPGTPINRDHNTAFCNILILLTDDLAKRLVSSQYPDGRAAWFTLAEKVRPNTIGASVSLLKEIISTTVKENRDPDATLEKYEELIRMLKAMNLTIDQLFVNLAICGLPKQYESLVSNMSAETAIPMSDFRQRVRGHYSTVIRLRHRRSRLRR